jgi:DNA polymerase III delta prime subunit
MRKEIVWVEKYRPEKIADCILPSANKKMFEDFVKHGKFPNLLLTGTAGTGKTTVAKALCNELDMEWILVNASKDGNIDTLRTKIQNFASTISLNGGCKCVIFDEADYLNSSSTQPALRGFIEEFTNCSFIFTCNFSARILGPVKSRLSTIEFKIGKAEKAQMATMLLDRLKFILESESVDYNEAVLIELIKKHFPDFRKTINELERYSPSGKIDTGILANLEAVKTAELIKALIAKDFSKVRKWVTDNSDNDTSRVFRSLYDSFYSKMQPKSIPQAILILADYQYKAAFVADHEINIMACLLNIMLECEWL